MTPHAILLGLQLMEMVRQNALAFLLESSSNMPGYREAHQIPLFSFEVTKCIYHEQGYSHGTLSSTRVYIVIEARVETVRATCHIAFKDSDSWLFLSTSAMIDSRLQQFLATCSSRGHV